MKQVFIILFILLSINIEAQEPTGYYDNTEGLAGYVLKSALNEIITNGHNPQSYGSLWDGYYTSDVDNYYENDGTVLDIYSENPNGNDPYEYSFGNNQCGNYANEGDCYNREHLFPKSWFNNQAPMETDIQHIYPTDGKVNGQRGNLPFGEVNNPNWASSNGSKKGANVYNYQGAYTGTVFEPIDEFKGDIARVYFYMATRYENEIDNWNGNTGQSDIALNGTSTQVYENWFLDMLITWNASDPVSQKEIDRNNAAYNFQGNRNPFIDHPEWVNAIWNPEADTEAPTAPLNLDFTALTSTSIDLIWDAATDNTAVSDYQIEMNNEIVETTTNTTITISNLSPETSYSFVIYAVDNFNNVSNPSEVLTVTTSTMGITNPTKVQVNLWPNPAKDTLHLNIQAKMFSYKIFNINGKQVQQNNTYKKNNINISSLPQGIYFISISVNNQQLIGKFIKK